MGDFVTSFLVGYNSYLSEVFNGNEMLIGMVSTMLLGSLIYLLKTGPLSIYRFIVKHTTKVLSVSSDSYVYNDIMAVLEDKGVLLKTRSLRLKNGIWGWSKTPELVVGIDSSWYYINGTFILITVKQENLNSNRIIHTILIRAIGRSSGIIGDMVKESIDKNNRADRTNVYRVKDDEISLYSSQHRYSLKDIVLDEPTEAAMGRVKGFAKSKDIFKENSLIWKYGVLLHGIPGSGKTKLGKCIAGELGWDILEIKSIGDLGLISKLDGNEPTVVFIEEIDSMLALGNDKGKDDDSSRGNDMEFITAMLRGEFLTALDGICELDGVLIIATTNNFDKLDEAMYRDGRMDEIIEFVQMGLREFKLLLEKYYGDNSIPETYRLKDGVVGSNIEKAFKQKLSFQEVLDKFEYIV